MSPPPPPPAPQRRRRRRAAIGLGAAALIALLLVLALPAILRAAIPWYLADKGLESSIDRVSVDLWDGRVGLFGLRVGPEGRAALRFERLVAVLDWSALLGGEAPLRRLDLAGGELDTGALGAARWGGDGEAGTQARGAPAIPEVDLRDIALTDLGSRIGQPLVIRSVRVAPLGPPGADAAQLSLELALGDAPLSLQGTVAGLSGAPRFSGRLRAGAVRLEGLERVIPGGLLTRLAGQVTVDTALQAGFDPRGGRVTVALHGSHEIREAVFEGAGARGSGDALLIGRVNAEWPLLATPTVRMDGVLQVPALLLQQGADGAAELRVRLGGARFDGRAGTGTGAVPVLSGRIAADTASLAPGAAAPVSVELDGLEAYLQTMAPAAPGATLPDLQVEAADAAQLRVAGEGFEAVELSGLRVEDLRVAAAGEAGARVLGADRVRSGPPGGGWQVDGARLESARRGADGTLLAGRASAGSVAVGAGGAATRVGAIEITGLRREPGGALSLARAAAQRVEVGNGAPATRVGEVVLESFRRAAGGEMAAARASVEALQVAVAGAPLEAAKLVAAELQVGADRSLRAARVSAASARHAPDGGPAWSLTEATVESLAVDGGARVELAAVSLAGARVVSGDAQVDLEAAQASGVQVSADGAVAFSAARAGQVRADLAAGGTLAVGRLELEGVRVAGPAALSAERAAGASLEYRRGDDRVQVASPLLERVSGGAGEGGPALEVERASVQATRVSGADGTAPVTLEGVSLSAARLDGAGSVGLEALRLNRLRVGVEAEPALSLAILDLRGLTSGGGGIDLEGGSVSDLQASVERRADGSLDVPALPFTGAPGAGGDDPPGGVPALRIGHFETAGDTRVRFVDREPDPPFQVQLEPLSVTVDGLDTRPGGGAGRFVVNGRLGEFSRVEFNGTTGPGKNGLDLGFDGRLTGVDLALLTPYLSQFQGLAVKTGRADVTFSGSLAGDEIAAQTEFLLSKLTLEPDARAAAGQGAAGGGMPLSTALMLLKDDKDNVRLKVPVSGKLDDPKFDLSDAVGQAVAKAATGAVMLAFQPVGLLVTAAGVVGGLSGVGFEPVTFQPADAELAAEGITRLDALAGALKDKPALRLRVCGRATPADSKALAAAGRPAGADALAALARARGEKVRSYLDRKHQVDAARLPECPAVVDAEDGAGPRADLALDAGLSTGAAPGAASPAPATRN